MAPDHPYRDRDADRASLREHRQRESTGVAGLHHGEHLFLAVAPLLPVNGSDTLARPALTLAPIAS